MTQRVLTASMLAAALLVGPAHAGGDSGWSGLYIGGHAGVGWSDVDLTTESDTTSFWDFLPGSFAELEPDGVLGGGQVGYNLGLGPFVVGVELTGSALDLDETQLLGVDDDTSFAVDWLATASGRLGYAFTPASLLYLKGGYAMAGIETSAVDFIPAAGAFSTDERHDGWLAGAGYEHKLSQSVSLGLEYNFIDLNDDNHIGVDPGGTVVNDIDVQLHNVTARLNFHLN